MSKEGFRIQTTPPADHPGRIDEGARTTVTPPAPKTAPQGPPPPPPSNPAPKK